MNRCTRRQALALGSAAVVSTTSGCASINPFSEDDDAPSDFRAWLPAEAIWEHPRPTVTYENFDGLIADLPSEHERIQDILESIGQWALPSVQLDGRLIVNAGELLGTLFLGNFDAERVLDAMDPAEENTESVGEFTMIGSSRAVGPGVVVLSTAARTFVDTYRGDVDRIHEVESRWDDALDDVVDADLARLTAPQAAPFDVLGLGANVAEEQTFEGTARAHFVAEADAADNVDALDSYVRELADDDVTTLISETGRDGTVVEIEVLWPSIPF